LPKGLVPPVPIHLLPPWWRSFCSSRRCFERFHQLVPAAHGLDLGALLLAQQLERLGAQPLVGDGFVEAFEHLVHALEVGGEGAVVAVELALVLDQDGAAQDVEVVQAEHDDVLAQGFQQGQKFAQAGL